MTNFKRDADIVWPILKSKAQLRERALQFVKGAKYLFSHVTDSGADELAAWVQAQLDEAADDFAAKYADLQAALLRRDKLAALAAEVEKAKAFHYETDDGEDVSWIAHQIADAIERIIGGKL